MADPTVVDQHLYLADVLFEVGQFERGAEEYDAWLPRDPHLLDREWYELMGLGSRRGELLIRQRKYREAEPLVVRGYEFMRDHRDRILPLYRTRLAEAGERVVRLYEVWGKPEKAAEWRAKVRPDAPAASPSPNPPPEAKR